MKTIKNLERLQQLHFLIKAERTGSPYEISKQLSVSERMVYTLVEQLKSLEAVIGYDRKRRSYQYLEPFQLHIRISVSVINKDNVTKLYDGSYFEQPLKNETS